MPQDNGESVNWFELGEAELEPEDFGPEDFEQVLPTVSFEEALTAIQSDAMAPNDLIGFSDVTRKQVHQLRSVWQGLAVDQRRILADLALMVAQENIYVDLGRFFGVLLGDEDTQVQIAAAHGALLSEDESLIRILGDIAEHDGDMSLREAVIRAYSPHIVGLDMGVIADAQDIRRLMRLKEWAQDPEWPAQLRAAALESYAHHTADDDTAEIIEQFVESGDEALELGALKAMTAYGPGKLISFLERKLQSTDVDQREAAAKAIGQSQDMQAVPILTMVAREDVEPTVREAAYIGLGEQGSEQALLALQQLREHAADDDLEIIDYAIMNAQDALELEELGMFEFHDQDFVEE